MAPSAQAHKRSHSLLLLQKLLNLRDNASPLTLVLDTLEQGSTPVLQEFTTRAKISHTKVIFISFATIKKPANADILVRATGKPLQKLQAEITSHYPAQSPPPTARNATSSASSSQQKTLLIIDTLNPLSTTHPRHLTPFLSSLLPHPTISLVATYHADVPLALAPSALSEYEPHPLTVLNHLATAVLRVSSLHQAAETKRARDRSLPEPAWGLAEGREGALVGVKGPAPAARGGVVVEMELRRRSGRAVVERFVLEQARGGAAAASASASASASAAGTLSLLSDHPLLASPVGADDDGQGEDEDLAETTFNLGLTEKQRKDREGIVLPYFDAQKDVGGGEGGRILYEMGREDDFDDEEDEI
ncbi:histone acetylation protein 2 [Diaporthe helianthi]|uniref:Elongator complex protein 5 n=1 Tax=Diaporthe helianthi TaxID=158607 RepID=A0A2P5I382_DIAHE|nr:histone acetylation protein 2 [Diaporthe helianthi]